MKRATIIVATLLLAIGMIATAALAQQGQGEGPPGHSQSPHAPDDAADGPTVIGTTNIDSTNVSPGYGNDDNIVDTVELEDGDWKITTSGAIQVEDTSSAPNCGLIGEDADGKFVIGKSNFAGSDFVGRSGFAVTGHTTVSGDNVDVHLVCYGAGNEPFEYNLVAVGG